MRAVHEQRETSPTRCAAARRATSPSSRSTRPSTAGLVQYYLLAQDVFRLGRLRWVMETSLLKTLAGKHRSTVTKMARKYKTRHRDTGRAANVPSRSRRTRRGRKPLVARFGGIPLKRATHRGPNRPAPVMASARRNELIHRLLAGRCEICE